MRGPQWIVNIPVRPFDGKMRGVRQPKAIRACRSNAIADPGMPEQIGRVFAGFQKYRHQHRPGSQGG
jgi:hypothetical protein